MERARLALDDSFNMFDGVRLVSQAVPEDLDEDYADSGSEAVAPCSSYRISCGSDQSLLRETQACIRLCVDLPAVQDKVDDMVYDHRYDS